VYFISDNVLDISLGSQSYGAQAGQRIDVCDCLRNLSGPFACSRLVFAERTGWYFWPSTSAGIPRVSVRRKSLLGAKRSSIFLLIKTLPAPAGKFRCFSRRPCGRLSAMGGALPVMGVGRDPAPDTSLGLRSGFPRMHVDEVMFQ
jgi:hypothetical protein